MTSACVICERPAVVATRALTGWRQPVCRACGELARTLRLPTIEAREEGATA